MEPNVVLVTGGSGMLGQQVVKHVDMFVKGVTEIRVFDRQPYENKLGKWRNNMCLHVNI